MNTTDTTTQTVQAWAVIDETGRTVAVHIDRDHIAGLADRLNGSAAVGESYRIARLVEATDAEVPAPAYDSIVHVACAEQTSIHTYADHTRQGHKSDARVV